MRISKRELEGRAEALGRRLSRCSLCPNGCAVDRWADGRGRCRSGASARVASFGPHFGEERVLVGSAGSGTIFFSGCNLVCLYCQNWTISQEREGTDVADEELAGILLSLQRAGCANANLVTPTPHAASIVRALVLAVEAGFERPIVWNCGGYESVEVLQVLDGIVDIYMPDLKYGNDDVGRQLSGIPDYVRRSQQALREMHRQVGDLVMDADGIARRGLLVRHLILPEGLAGTDRIVRFLAREISPDTYVNLMDQYRPCYRAAERPELRRRITPEEYAAAQTLARTAGLHRFRVARSPLGSVHWAGRTARWEATDVMKDEQRLEAIVHGDVQGVFFRHHTRLEATRLGLSGTVRNLADGTVEVIAEGPHAALERLLAWLHRGPEMARVERVDARWRDAKEASSGFVILR